MAKDQYKIVATIYDKRGQVISTATNSYSKTHTKQAFYAKKAGLDEKIFLHAEIAALVRCRKKPHSIHIERYGKHGDPLMAKPCPICEMAIKEAGIKIISHTI